MSPNVFLTVSRRIFFFGCALGGDFARMCVFVRFLAIPVKWVVGIVTSRAALE